ncbi:MAG: peptide ABC transporter substrate-binding protein [bacterium]|nr:peptide ABC transporter substrate-binding protein [bacterium]
MKKILESLKKLALDFLRTVKEVSIREFKRLPLSVLNRKQWLYLPRLLSKREKIILTSLLFFVFVSAATGFGRLYLRITVAKPGNGGTYREGLLKEPRFINPIYASNDADRDIAELVFPGLIRYSPEGEIEPYLAETVDVSDDGKNYTIHLKNNITWHDGEPLTANDVIFTIKTIQNPEFKSPYRQNWQGVLIEKIDNRTVRFILRQPYAPFIENLTIGIIPEHLWSKIPPQSAPLSDLNLKPIGSGPYIFDAFTRLADGSVTSYTLTSNRSFFLRRPHLNGIIFKIYPSETELVAGFRKGEIDGISTISAKNLPSLQKTTIQIYPLQIPRVVAIFFNEAQQSAFADKNIRLALAKAIDTKAIINDVLLGGGEMTSSPIPPGSAGFNPDIPLIGFNPDEAKSLLEKAGWKNKNENGILIKTQTVKSKKVITPLKIELTTSDFPELVEVANKIKDMWRGVGVDLEIKVLTAASLETMAIRPRAYQALLFGEIFGHDPDPFAFWHTSQIKDPGLNIALYSNRKVDTLLEEARRTTDELKREEKYREFQKIVAQDMPAIFLFSPLSYYGVGAQIKGVIIDRIALPQERFAHIENWYTKTSRGLK